MGWNFTKDGRLVLTERHYKALKTYKIAEQDGNCADCPGVVTEGTGHLHHQSPGKRNPTRGMAGSLRNDRPELTKVLCPRCHRKRHA